MRKISSETVKSITRLLLICCLVWGVFGASAAWASAPTQTPMPDTGSLWSASQVINRFTVWIIHNGQRNAMAKELIHGSNSNAMVDGVLMFRSLPEFAKQAELPVIELTEDFGYEVVAAAPGVTLSYSHTIYTQEGDVVLPPETDLSEANQLEPGTYLMAVYVSATEDKSHVSTASLLWLVVNEAKETYYDPYEAKVAYALETFGFEADPAYPYLPTHLDPVCYNGYPSLIAGCKDDEIYAAYGSYTEADAQDYLGYLQYWGYDISEQTSSLPGMREWRAVSSSSRQEGKQLMEYIRIYHSAEKEMLTVAYPYLDGFMYTAWSNSTFDSVGMPRKKGSIPYKLDLSTDCAVKIEEMSYRREIEIRSATKPDVKPYSTLRLEADHMTIERTSFLKQTWKMETTSDQKERSSGFLCLRLAFSKTVDSSFMKKLCMAVADMEPYASHIADSPMLYACVEKGMLSVWTDKTESERAVVIFPPTYYDVHQPKRIYMYLKEPNDSWIGDLREWKYIDLYQPGAPKIAVEDIPEIDWSLWCFE